MCLLKLYYFSGYHSGSPVKREIDMDDDDMPLTQKVRMVQPEVILHELFLISKINFLSSVYGKFPK